MRLTVQGKKHTRGEYPASILGMKKNTVTPIEFLICCCSVFMNRQFIMSMNVFQFLIACLGRRRCITNILTFT